MGMKYNHDLEKYVDHLQSLSGNSDKETSAIDLLRQLCTLKKYKDVNGKDDYYKKSQPELWKKANYLASESEVKKEQPTDKVITVLDENKGEWKSLWVVGDGKEVKTCIDGELISVVSQKGEYFTMPIKDTNTQSIIDSSGNGNHGEVNKGVFYCGSPRNGCNNQCFICRMEEEESKN